MSSLRRKSKKRLCIQHRSERYNHAIQKVIDGRAKPEFATERWNKLQQARGNDK